MQYKISRRMMLVGAASTLLMPAIVGAAEGLQDIADMRPGEFTWHPDRVADGPVAIIVSLVQQRVHIYRNGIRIAVSTCSSGKSGHETPTGVFVILQKDKYHKSSTYSDAPMPNMNRLTWSGIALHAGNLPGYPASHGCVRLPLAFSADLFQVTHLGTPVIIAGEADPFNLTHPGMVLDSNQAGRFSNIVAADDGKKHPDDWTAAEALPITSAIISTSDKHALLIENDDIIAEGPISIDGAGAVGEHVFTLQRGGSSGELQWVDISRSTSSGSLFHSEANLLARLHTSKDFASAMQAKLHPGMVLVVTQAPLQPDNRTGRDFVLMTAME